MRLFRSFRTRLAAAFGALSLAAVAVMDWQAAAAGADALRRANLERLAAIRETKRRQIENYLQDAANHVLALSTDESALRALEEFREAWARVPGKECGEVLREYYARYPAPPASLPDEPRRCGLQEIFLVRNPHPLGAKELLLSAPEAGEYGRLHARYHPTFHRYLSAFGFYDIFLIDASEARLLYTVRKEIDFLGRLDEGFYKDSGLGRAYERAMKLRAKDEWVMEDYTRYAPSHDAPAAFLAAPIWRAGMKTGVLAIQISIDELNLEMTGGRNWEAEGLGATGQAYLVGSDGYLRSDLRLTPEKSGLDAETLDRVLRDGTGVLNIRVDVGEDFEGEGRARDLLGRAVFRSAAPLRVPEVNWRVMAEMTVEEALAPVTTLRYRLLAAGVSVALLVAAAAWLVAARATRPVLALAEGARRLGQRDFSLRVESGRSDEIGELADSFNRMAENLEKTTVSKAELEELSRRLIQAQEEERSRLARELHDDVSQRLAALAIDAGRMKIPGFQQRIADLARDVHGLSRSLHPAMLRDLGLVAAIETEARGLFDRGGPPVHLSAGGDLETLSEEAALCLYRVTQEALANAHRHGEASEVRVLLTRGDGRVRLEVEDDGKGFDRDSKEFRAGLGLASMRERVELLGGRFAVHSRAGEGTKIEVELPDHDG
jgi:methyl-accepting chemotaxis protein